MEVVLASPGDVPAAQRHAFDAYLESMASGAWAATMALACPAFADPRAGLAAALALPDAEVLAAAAKHGDIGQRNRAALDALAKSEQAKVAREGPTVDALIAEGAAYRVKFGVKFLVSAQGKTAEELLAILRSRAGNSREEEWRNARVALWEIAAKRLQLPGGPLAYPEGFAAPWELPEKHGVEALSAAVSLPGGGAQRIAGAWTSKPLSPEAEALLAGGPVLFEIASLSKTLAVAMALDYFRAKGIPSDTPANELFAQTGSKFRIVKSPEAAGTDWSADEVTLAHLTAHCALNMHYVNGVPADRPMPPIEAFLYGNDEYGYEPVSAINRPGTTFKYSGGGFLALEHLLEAHSGQKAADMGDAFLASLGLRDTTFRQESLPGRTYALGRRDDGTVVHGGRLMFPSFAAGMMSTPADVIAFLAKLAEAYKEVDPAKAGNPISHDAARWMLHGTDIGSRRFMGCLMGLGVFVAEAGPNKFAVHQGANDGFRAVFLYCFEGPDAGFGVVACANADQRAVGLISELLQGLLVKCGVRGVDRAAFRSSFSADGVRQEEIVNTGYRELVFRAFEPAKPEPIARPSGAAEHPARAADVLRGCEGMYCSNDRFGRWENLVCGFEPAFDPALFGAQGKVMDSWETVRHNPHPCDALTLRLREPSRLRYVEVSTRFHLGNQAPEIRILGFADAAFAEAQGTLPSVACSLGMPEGAIEVLPRFPLEGHSLVRIDLGAEAAERNGPLAALTIQNIPDGGITRVALFAPDFDPSALAADGHPFEPVAGARCRRHAEAIPKTQKPLAAPPSVSPEEAARNRLAARSAGPPWNAADALLGAAVIAATDEHYSPAALIISPGPPLDMFDGLESARSRRAGSSESATVRLAWPCEIEAVDVDFTYFRNNNPKELGIEYLSEVGNGNGEPAWKTLVPCTPVKPFAGSVKRFAFGADRRAALGPAAVLRISAYPCGGFNRVRVWTHTPLP
ncbi:galactose-binding domain-like protein [Hyaloraphidium curvatum]|nr:galactose-binding domain-like protein [Hyaloraphidium curvatum]